MIEFQIFVLSVLRSRPLLVAAGAHRPSFFVSCAALLPLHADHSIALHSPFKLLITRTVAFNSVQLLFIINDCVDDDDDDLQCF